MLNRHPPGALTYPQFTLIDMSCLPVDKYTGTRRYPVSRFYT